MKLIEIFADNIKCSGCVANIVDGLNTLPNVQNIGVDIIQKKVSLNCDEETKQLVILKLKELGYPEINN